MAYLQSTSSGLKNADGAIVTQPCKIHAITLNPGTTASSAILYDNASAASGTVAFKIVGAANDTSCHAHLDVPVACQNGIYLDISGTGADCVIYYSLGI